MATRHKEEFRCSIPGGGCGKYFWTWLRDDMWGEYTIVCPACGHEHFRMIKEGLVTEDRHNSRDGHKEKLYFPKSRVSNTPYMDDPDFRRQNLKVYEGGGMKRANY